MFKKKHYSNMSLLKRKVEGAFGFDKCLVFWVNKFKPFIIHRCNVNLGLERFGDRRGRLPRFLSGLALVLDKLEHIRAPV